MNPSSDVDRSPCADTHLDTADSPANNGTGLFRAYLLPLLALLFASASSATTSNPSPSAIEARAERCQALTAPAGGAERIESAHLIAAAAAMPAHCRVDGTAGGTVGFSMLLPQQWNGKLLQLGARGHGGEIAIDECLPALRRGYACVMSDTGHRGIGSDARWADGNLQARVDWGYRAPHVTAIAAKEIVARLYGRPARHAYFWGCSTGGRHALQAAQRFPTDYDGIIAGAPPVRIADTYLSLAWGQRAAHDAAGRPILDLAALRLLTSAALARCDKDDGIADGIIGAPARCGFRPADLLCRPGQTQSCLSAAQIAAAQSIYRGPADAAGISLTGGGAMPGSEYGGDWNARYGGNWGIYYSGTATEPPAYAALTQGGLKYLFLDQGRFAEWSLKDFDPERDYDRLAPAQALYDASNPDLTRFKAAGGKLIIYHGLNDLAVLPHWVTGYYEKVERVMGGSTATRSFARLFSLPGVEHCLGGAGADQVDYLSALEIWVERGQAPNRLIAFHLLRPADQAYTSAPFPIAPDTIAFSRPLFPYPYLPRYDGIGDPNAAASFRPVVDRRDR